MRPKVHGSHKRLREDTVCHTRDVGLYGEKENFLNRNIKYLGTDYCVGRIRPDSTPYQVGIPWDCCGD